MLQKINGARAALVGGVLAAPVLFANAQSTGTDFSSLTSAIDFSTVGTAILAVAALMVVPAVVRFGAKKVLGFLGR